MKKDCLKRLMACGLAAGVMLLAGRVEMSRAAGLVVSPGGLVIQGVRPGMVYNIYEVSKTGLTIYNKDNKPFTYLLSVHRPSTVGNRKLKIGYLEIPDPEWCWFENKELSVAANGAGLAKIYLRIPDEEKYYNQHWVVTLGVMSKPSAGLGVGLGIYVRLQIETQSKADLEGIPDGIIAFAPSTFRFDNITLGNAHKGSVLIYNNDNETRTYRISSLLHSEETRARHYLTRPYRLIPDPEWIVSDKKTFRVGPGGARSLSLTLAVPDKPEYYGKKWEEILLVKPDKGVPGFVRVQIETRKARVN